MAVNIDEPEDGADQEAETSADSSDGDPDGLIGKLLGEVARTYRTFRSLAGRLVDRSNG